MGDPRRTRSTFKGPRHPWNKERIESEKTLIYTYGLVNKRELWKAESKLTTYKDNAKKLLAQNTKQAEKELGQLYAKLQKYGLMGKDASADDVLGLQTEQLLDRRLQTLVFKHEMAHTPKQARQFITHGHILVAGKKMTVPSYLVPVGEESTISFNTASALFAADHPERVAEKKQTGAGKKEEAKTEKEKAAEPAPVTETEETPEKEKPIEQQIEEDTDNAAEVAEAVEEAEAENIAQDHEQAVKEAASKDEKPAKKEADTEQSPEKQDNEKGDAQ